MLTTIETINRLDAFYNGCLKFWNKEITEDLIIEGYTPKKLALKDVEKLNRDPYSPNGKPLSEEGKSSWLNWYK